MLGTFFPGSTKVLKLFPGNSRHLFKTLCTSKNESGTVSEIDFSQAIKDFKQNGMALLPIRVEKLFLGTIHKLCCQKGSQTTLHF